MDGWMDRCECLIDAKVHVQRNRERKERENAVKHVDDKETKKDKMDSSALKQMHAGVSIVDRTEK